MKITLHDSIPAGRRQEIETLVEKHVGKCEIVWMPSRFPRIVMLVEPTAGHEPEPAGGSFFESPRLEEESSATTARILEEKISNHLSTPSAP